MNKAELIAALKAELQEQWEENHAEHCAWLDPPIGGKCKQSVCMWPRPEILDREVS